MGGGGEGLKIVILCCAVWVEEVGGGSVGGVWGRRECGAAEPLLEADFLRERRRRDRLSAIASR